MAGWFDTVTGTSPASWYPLNSRANNAAASPLSPGPLDTSWLFGPSPSSTPASSAPGIAAPPSTSAPAPSLTAPDTNSPSDFSSMFPYLKLGLQGAGGLNSLAGGGGATAGGLSALQGLLGAYQSLFGNGSGLSKALGTIQGLGGAASGGATASDALGLTSGLGGAIGGFAAPAGVLAQLASIFGGPVTEEGQNQQALQAGVTGITAPIAGAAAATAASLAPVGSILAALAPTLSAISGPLAVAGPVLGVAMAIMDALGKPGNRDINRFTGVQGPQTTQALSQAAGFTPPSLDFNQLDTGTLEKLIGAQGNALGRYYNENLPEARYMGGLQKTNSPELGQIQSSLGTTQSGVLRSIANLQQRGMSAQDIGNIMSPQLNSVSQMYNPAFAMDTTYQSPAAMMQRYALQNNQQLANAYGGPTWLALNQIYGPQLATVLGQYGIKGPQADFSAYAPKPSAPAAPTPQQIALPYQWDNSAFTSGGG